MIPWQSLTPREVLATFPALSLEQAAYVLGLTFTSRHARAGQPDRRKVIELIDRGELALIDPSVPVAYQTVRAAEVARRVGVELGAVA